MNTATRLFALATATLAFTIPSDLLAERTDQGTVEIGGNFLYDTDTPAGGRLSLDLLGGYYVADEWLIGADGRFSDDDYGSVFGLSFLLERSFELGDADTVTPFVPYLGGSFGYADADYKNYDSSSGLVFGMRAGIKLMLTGSLAIDFSFHADFATGDVFYDDDGPSKNDFTFRIGLRTFLF